MSMALRMMQVAPSASCSKSVASNSKQDVPRVSPSTFVRATRNNAIIYQLRRGDHLSRLVAQAVRGDQQVDDEYGGSVSCLTTERKRGDVL